MSVDAQMINIQVKSTLVLLGFVCVFIGIECKSYSVTDLFKLHLSKDDSFRFIPHLVQNRWTRNAERSSRSEQDDKADSLTYALTIDDQDVFIYLKKNKDFLSRNFVQYTDDASGNLMTTYPKGHDHCYYHGQVDGHKDSLVALSTCSGLSGVIILGEESYGLEPAAESARNEHLLFRLKHKQPGPFVCGSTDEQMATEKYSSHDPATYMSKLIRKKRNLPDTRYIELALVVDNHRFNISNRNVTAVREEMIALANLLDGYYKQLNIRVVLVALQIFQTANPFSVDTDSGTVLTSFVSWRKKVLLPQINNDAAQLIVGRTTAFPGGILGLAFVGTVCSSSSAGGIAVYGDHNLGYFSTVVAHELGHNMGMAHDKTGCTCSEQTCIMDAYATGSTFFSNCSEANFETLVLRGGGICLKNQPAASSAITEPICGNGLLEQGEDCDCGTPSECTNKCCDASTCKLTRGSACAQGSCCQNCQLLVSGTPCRQSVNTCDLPEYCNGTSGFCPNDFYLIDGLPCENNTAYCYEGRCQSYTYQCMHLFGQAATQAANICFQTANTMGDRFGNCGMSGSSFVPCTVANSMCGKVQCTNVNANFPPDGATISVVITQGSECVNADFNLGSDVLDPGYVVPGCSCAPGKTCINFQCVDASALKPNLTCNAATTCNNRGVCNNLGHCHCENGWGPLYCDKAGRGGSIDSGPAQIDYSLRNGLLIFFLLVVPVLVLIILVLLYVFKRDSLKPCLKWGQHRSKSSPENPNIQRNARPQPAARGPPPPAQSMSTQPASDSPASSNNTNYRSIVPPPQQQGPGVPRPIPPPSSTVQS